MESNIQKNELSKENLERAIALFSDTDLQKGITNIFEKGLTNGKGEIGKENLVTIQKSLDTLKLIQSEFPNLLKGMFTDVEKAFSSQQTVISQQNDVIKGIISKNASLSKQITDIGEMPLTGRKSGLKDKDFIEKGFNTEEQEETKKENVFSLSKDKETIKSILKSRMEVDLKKGLRDSDYIKGALSFDTRQSIPKNTLIALNKEGIQIVR